MAISQSDYSDIETFISVYSDLILVISSIDGGSNNPYYLGYSVS